MIKVIMCFVSPSEVLPCAFGAGPSYQRIKLPTSILSTPQGRPSQSQSPTPTQPLLPRSSDQSSEIPPRLSDHLTISKLEQQYPSGPLSPATSSSRDWPLTRNLGSSELHLSANDDCMMSEPCGCVALSNPTCIAPTDGDEGSPLGMCQNRSLCEESSTKGGIFAGCGFVGHRTHKPENTIEQEIFITAKEGSKAEGNSTMEEFGKGPLTRPHNARRRRRDIDLILQGNKKAMQKVFRNRRSAARSNAKRRRVRQQYQLEMEQMIDEKERLEAIKEELVEMNIRLKAQLARVYQVGPSI